MFRTIWIMHFPRNSSVCVLRYISGALKLLYININDIASIYIVYKKLYQYIIQTWYTAQSYVKLFF